MADLQDHADAVAAAKRLSEIIRGGSSTVEPDVCCAPQRSLNLAATAALHAGLNIDPRELREDVVVAKARPVAVGNSLRPKSKGRAVLS